ncbi:MAG: diversity-generating retroelement protein Avd [Chloroflexota bacterium]
MSDDMVIFTRCFDLMVWLVPKLQRFPTAYRTTLSQRMGDALLDYQEALHDANAHPRQRLTYLQSADAHLSKLRFYLRLIHRMEWINNGQYEHVSRMVEENGRLLGGWIKQTRAKGRG